MQIRSVTYGVTLSRPDDTTAIGSAGRFLAAARERCAEAGLVLQTVRMATQPFPFWSAARDAVGAASEATAIQAACRDAGVDYCSLGPAGRSLCDVAEPPEATTEPITWIPEILRRTDAVFATAAIAGSDGVIDLQAIAAAAAAIRDIADTTELGFGNLRFAALANCPSGSPFFPVAFHDGGPLACAVAVEAADLALEAVDGARSLAEARQRLVQAVEAAASRIVAAVEPLARERQVRFGGLDFSLAPFPTADRSIGTAFERLGVDAFGASGSLFAAAFLTEALERSVFPRCGFCGLMLPVLEDATLAGRSGEGLYTLDSLLMYSAVCGTGLDTVPLPGDIEVGELAAILLDVAALAVRLHKPLTARLMPIPGKHAGDVTDFDFPYFANARILDVRGRSSVALWSRDRTISMKRIAPDRGSTAARL